MGRSACSVTGITVISIHGPFSMFSDRHHSHIYTWPFSDRHHSHIYTWPFSDQHHSHIYTWAIQHVQCTASQPYLYMGRSVCSVTGITAISIHGPFSMFSDQHHSHIYTWAIQHVQCPASQPYLYMVCSACSVTSITAVWTIHNNYHSIIYFLTTLTLDGAMLPSDITLLCYHV